MAKLYDFKKKQKLINDLDLKRKLADQDTEDENTERNFEGEPTADEIVKKIQREILFICEDQDIMSDKLLELKMRREAARILLESIDEEIDEVKDAIIEQEILRRELNKDLEDARKAAKSLMLPNSDKATA